MSLERVQEFPVCVPKSYRFVVLGCGGEYAAGWLPREKSDISFILAGRSPVPTPKPKRILYGRI